MQCKSYFLAFLTWSMTTCLFPGHIENCQLLHCSIINFLVALNFTTIQISNNLNDTRKFTVSHIDESCLKFSLFSKVTFYQSLMCM